MNETPTQSSATPAPTYRPEWVLALLKGTGLKAQEHRSFLNKMFAAHPDITEHERNLEQSLLQSKAYCLNDFDPGNMAAELRSFRAYFHQLLDDEFGWGSGVQPNTSVPKLPAIYSVPALNISVRWNPEQTYPFTDVNLKESVLWWKAPHHRLIVTIHRNLACTYTFMFEQTNVQDVAMPGLVPVGMLRDLAEFVSRFPLRTIESPAS